MKEKAKKIKAGRNRTIVLEEGDVGRLKSKLIKLKGMVQVDAIVNKTIHQDLFEVLGYLPENFVDLLFIDPPYNLTKEFNSGVFKEMPIGDYEMWIESWLVPLSKVLKRTASIYICGDWKCSSAIFKVMSKYFKVRNRITWEREKGRGAKSNWKNCSEDIWFGTVSDDYFFNSSASYA